MSEPTMIVATPDQIRALLRAAVEEVLAERAQSEREVVYLTLEQAAELVNVHERTVRKLIAKQNLPASRIGGMWRFPRHELIAWIDRQRADKLTPAPTPIRSLRKSA